MSGCCDLLVQYLSGSTALGIYGCMPNPSWEVVRNVTKSADFAALSAVSSTPHPISAKRQMKAGGLGTSLVCDFLRPHATKYVAQDTKGEKCRKATQTIIPGG